MRKVILRMTYVFVHKIRVFVHKGKYMSFRNRFKTGFFNDFLTITGFACVSVQFFGLKPFVSPNGKSGVLMMIKSRLE